MRMGNSNSEHPPVGSNGQGGVGRRACCEHPTRKFTPPRGWAHRSRVNRGFLHMACDGVGSGLVIRVQMTHEDCATRPRLTRISVKLIFICETADTADGENGVGGALLSPSVSIRLSEA